MTFDHGLGMNSFMSNNYLGKNKVEASHLSEGLKKIPTLITRHLWLWLTMGVAVFFVLTWYEVPLVSSQGMVVRAHFQEGEIPSHPSDPAWETVSPLPLPLSGQIITRPVWPEPSVRALSIRSIHNGKEVAFLWNGRMPPSTSL